MRVRRIESDREVEELAGVWNRLACGVPFRTWDWQQAWWRHYGAAADRRRGPELYVLCVEDECGQTVGLAPWYLEASATQGRVLRFLSGDDGCSVCADYLGLVCDPRHRAGVAEAVAAWLEQSQHADQGRHAWDRLELLGVDAEDPALTLLTERLEAGGCAVHRKPGLNTWRLDLPGSWEKYLAVLSKSHRKQVRRAQRRVLQSPRARVRWAEGENEVRRGMAILIKLHQRRRRSLGEPGSYASPPYETFMETVCERFALGDRLRLGWIELDGEPVAAELNFAGDGVVYSYQSGLDPSRLAEEPGRLMQIAVLERAVEEGMRAVDFLRGDEPYKQHWRAKPRATLEVHIASRSSWARLRHGVWLAGERAKGLVKALVPGS